MQIRKNCKNESKLSNDILVFMSHDEGGVDHMKDSLYSRKHQGGMGDVRAPLSPSESHAPVAWQTDEAGLPRTKPKVFSQPLNLSQGNSRMGIATKFLIGSAAFFVLAIGGAAIFFFSGGNYISPKNIDLQVVAPALVDGGSTGNLQFIITNRNSAELQLADLVIEYPSGTRDPKNPQKSLNNERIPVGAIAPGQQIKLTSSAVFYGSEGDTQIIKASLEYSVQGSNAVFVKEGSASITIGSSPVSVRVETQSEAISGQPFTIKVTVQSNSPAPVQDVLVQAQYPFGYSVQSATPRADAGSTLWRLARVPVPRGQQQRPDRRQNTGPVSVGAGDAYGAPAVYNGRHSGRRQNRPEDICNRRKISARHRDLAEQPPGVRERRADKIKVFRSCV